ncbi:site-specific integrase [Bradyrhizobium sp. CCBAU 51745]|uniref:site-specific integrase n=1 Tax=Bradyrhizobium sp. CCBAU 51745 TaxID=1325099 RepID=UPI0023062E6A|nr:site-specific integrase [Bradyrhizobium sp. CCBAU 51745]
MPRVSHLIRRNGIYWFKVDLPDDLAGQPLPPSIPDTIKRLESPVRRGHLKTAVWLSLRTTVEREAKQRLGVQIAQHETVFEVARAFLTNGKRGSLPATQLAWIDGRASLSPLNPTPGLSPSRTTSAGPVATEEGLTITQAFHCWSRGGGVKGARSPAPNTITEADAARRRFVELFGDLAIHRINKAHGREYREAISRMPKGLPADMKQLSLPDLLQRDLSAYEPRSATTINKSLTLLGAVLARAEQDGHFDGTGWRNPFDVAFDIDPADEDYYEPFTRDELKLLMASPVFTAGVRPKRGRGETARWAPLLALFQGARRTEVIQLLVQDIAKDPDTDLWTLRFDREGDKRIKTLSSIRRVPIHPELVRLGFLSFVEERRSIVGPLSSLWPGFEDRSKLASRANKWSEWFNAYLAQHVVDDPVKKFHSFRGTFKRFGRAAGIDEVVINHLVGHSNHGVGARYGRRRDTDGVRDSGYPLPRLAEELSKIRFDGVRL